MSVIVHMIAPGYYEIHTPYGTFQISNCPVSRNDGMNTAGLRCGPRWMLTYPGEYSADADFPTKRDSIQQIKDVVEWELKNTTPGDLATQRRNYHGDNSPYREAPDPRATEKETEAVIDIETIPSTGCATHHVNDARFGWVLVSPTCKGGATYGVWDALAGGFTYAADCAMEAANWAAEQLENGDPDDYEMTVMEICREHAEQPAECCEDCFSNED